MGSRSISHSEASLALMCPAAHAFRYTGRLTGGDALRPLSVARRLSAGAAWGAGVAEWHATGDESAACSAILAECGRAADEDKAAGVYDEDEHVAMVSELFGTLRHYTANSSRLQGIRDLERRFVAQIDGMPSFTYLAIVDGMWDDADGNTWVVEFKLRGDASKLTDPETLPLLRQPRWYAVAVWDATGVEPAGVIFDERVSGAPGPVVLNKPGKDGSRVPRKGQARCSLPDYLAACEAAGVEPDLPTVTGLASREWGRRQHVVFMPGELEEARRELRALAQLVGAYDLGRVHPVRNVQAGVCRRCDFRAVCPDPSPSLVDAFYRRVTPKRLREDVSVGA